MSYAPGERTNRQATVCSWIALGHALLSYTFGTGILAPPGRQSRPVVTRG
ncbi:hypothetical protein AB0B85_33010 [Micromonospora sp. NPDC049044]